MIPNNLYRCGWCGLPTDKEGRVTSMFEVGRISDIDEVWKDAEHVHGECCRNDMQDAEDYYNRRLREEE